MNLVDQNCCCNYQLLRIHGKDDFFCNIFRVRGSTLHDGQQQLRGIVLQLKNLTKMCHVTPGVHFIKVKHHFWRFKHQKLYYEIEN